MHRPKQPNHREHLAQTQQRARSAEVVGLVLIAVVILAIMLTRFGHAVSWSWR